MALADVWTKRDSTCLSVSGRWADRTVLLYALHTSDDEASGADEQGQHHPGFCVTGRCRVRSYRHYSHVCKRNRPSFSIYQRVCGGAERQERWGGSCPLSECMGSAG